MFDVQPHDRLIVALCAHENLYVDGAREKDLGRVEPVEQCSIRVAPVPIRPRILSTESGAISRGNIRYQSREH